MQSSLETVALFALKLAYETPDQSPILRDDPIMGDYEREIFGVLVRRGDIDAIQRKLKTCLGLALEALGGVETPLGRELQKLSGAVAHAQTLEQLDTPLILLKDYLKDIQ